MTIPKSKRDFMRKPQKWYPHPNAEGVALTFISSKGTDYEVNVSVSDLAKVEFYRWYLKAGYAITSIGYKRVMMHHLIAGKPQKGLEIDHINRHKLDNTRTNLRTVLGRDNLKNQEGKGYRKRGNRYEAYVGVGGKYKSLGTYSTAGQARAAYKRAQQERINSIAA